MPQPPDPSLAFEREKWRDELRLRERDLALREAERARPSWRSPLVVAVAAAGLAALGNAAVTWIDGRLAREVERARADAQLALEARRADNELIRQMIESDERDVVRNNLAFLVEAGLLFEAERETALAGFLEDAPDASLPRLSPARLPQTGAEAAALNRRLEVLVIGNADYAHLPRLANPASDARLIGDAALQQSGGLYRGVRTRILANADHATMTGAFEDLAGRVDPARRDVVLIYYSGHAAAFDGGAYLLPVDAPSGVEDAGSDERRTVAAAAVSLGKVAELLAPIARDSAVVIAMDACHEGAEGFSLPFRQVEANVLLATAPGQACFEGQRNSPFAAALAAGLSEGDLDGDGAIFVSELDRFVRRRVREETDGVQIPFSVMYFDGIFARPVPDTTSDAVGLAVSPRADVSMPAPGGDGPDRALEPVPQTPGGLSIQLGPGAGPLMSP